MTNLCLPVKNFSPFFVPGKPRLFLFRFPQVFGFLPRMGRVGVLTLVASLDIGLWVWGE